MVRNMGVGIRLMASSYLRTGYKLQKILVLAKTGSRFSLKSA
jgi:hypothetical protein